MNTLLQKRGFLAFLSVAFINAFVDLGHKIIIQNTLFKSFSGNEQVVLMAIVNAFILLPFVLLFTPSGYFADRYSKTKVMKISAMASVLITSLITVCYYTGQFYYAFALTLVLSMQSAIYSPAKYGYIRELVGSENLSSANGWVQSLSMIAILAGSAAFSALFEFALPEANHYVPSEVIRHVSYLGWFLIAGSLLESFLAFRLPDNTQNHQTGSFDWENYLTGKTLTNNLKLLFKEKTLWQPVIGLTLFLAICQVMIATFPSYAKTTLLIDNTFTIQCIIAMAIIGLMLGSYFAASHSVKHINLSLIPAGAIMVCIALFFLPLTHSLTLLAGLFFMVGFGGSLMLVPLNALIQFHAGEAHLGKILAGNNFIQNIGMLLFLAMTVAFATTKMSVTTILWGIFVMSAIVAILTVVTMPQVFIRTILSRLVGFKYRLKILGFEHLPESGKGTLLLGNHISWIDWAIIQMSVPRHVYFVMDRTIYQRWYLKWFFDLFKVIPISPGQSKQALAQITSLLNQGETVCLFPEGRISHLGQLGEFKKGFERACRQAEGVIIPFYLRGMWGSKFSRSSEKLHKLRRSGIKRDITIAFGPSMDIHSTAAEVKQKVFEMSVSTWNDYADTLDTLPRTFIKTAKAKPAKWAVVDSNGKPVTHHRFLAGCLITRKHIKSMPGENIGLLLPTTSAGLMANIAAMMTGKTVVNINYTSSVDAIMAARNKAQIQSILTSRKFIEKLEKRGINCAEILDNTQVLYLEDMAGTISKGQKLRAFLTTWLLPARLLQSLFCPRKNRNENAAILFSSGSEGEPKGVVLTHKNIMANLRQVSDVLNVRENDRVMATLPLFHAFGLTVTGMLPLMEGIPVICHPDPTDGFNIAKAVAKYEATFMCATSTFLRMYQRNKKIKPLMLNSLRVIVSGAEKLDKAVKEAFQAKFMVPVLEGYGTTETTPVASVNLPGHFARKQNCIQEATKEGTVGLALPGTTFRIVDPVSLDTLPTGEDGLILVGGAQIMKGYLNEPEKTDSVLVNMDGMLWYKTGDKGHIDNDGYLTIVDRYSRFAKLGGEMVSLGAVEQTARELLGEDDLGLVAVNLPDEKKGEQIVLLVESQQEPSRLKQILKKNGMPNLMIPSQIFNIEKIPLLGSGKVDFSLAKKLAYQYI
ncbi:acyl-[ACP]--phospholipid O-acyltransferase [Vibrio salinus]|uniref:acyl-[ACP]--phospholipid O-acyltransferase n=1 Tax=Vibrio salinus TaxID=2899784 RepID=UPI001E5A0C14|nr:acyl-[ACP]--phospholipid O-acyltransferase [Vibrio salinus]MCE0495040.1 acyl-[ACP]--phospholipid O-acyltransferase [Vibrio salinus]